MRKKSSIECVENLSLSYYPHFFSVAKANFLFDSLFQDIDWQQENYRMFGKVMPSPRLVAWYGDEGIDYRYSGICHKPLPWLPHLLEIKDTIETKLNAPFNSVLANLYRNERDSMGFHADNEPELGLEAIIASISLGDNRTLYMKNKTTKVTHKIPLNHGGLLVMAGQTQQYWLHAIPKQVRSIGPRINLTFRKILR